MTELRGTDLQEGQSSVFYPMNGTGDLEKEGYGQLLPIAAFRDDIDALTVMPASLYNSLNVDTVSEVDTALDQRRAYDRSKSGFLTGYLASVPDLDIDVIPAEDLYEDERFWETVEAVTEGYDVDTVRGYSPLPDRIAIDQELDAPTYLESIQARYPIDDMLIDAVEDFNARDLYLPFQAAEAAVMAQDGADTKLGIGQEAPFDQFTEDAVDVPTIRSIEPVDLDGEPVIPYSQRYTDSDQLWLGQDSIESDLRSGTAEAIDQYVETAYRLQDPVFEAVW